MLIDCPVIVPHMYDQHEWAARLCDLNLAPPPISKEELFDISTPAAQTAAQQRLVAALQFALAPQTRLRCGSLGRRLRTEEDGLARAGDLIEQHVSDTTHSARLADKSLAAASAATLPAIEGLVWHEFDSGVQLAFPKAALDVGRAENAFVRCSTLVSEQLASLQPGDLVVDVDAGVGMFSVCCELLFNEQNALRLLAVCTADEVNEFEALRLNLHRFNRNARCIQVRGGCTPDLVVQACQEEWAGLPIRVLRLHHRGQQSDVALLEFAQAVKRHVAVDQVVVTE